MMHAIVPDDPGTEARPARIIHRRSRALDWTCALMVLVIGILLALPGSTLETSSAYAEVLDRFSETTWAVLLLIVGMARMVALFINGRLPKGSPIVRAIASFAGVLTWAHFLAGFLDVSIRIGVPLAEVGFTLVMFGADLFTTGRASADAIEARRHVHRH